MKADAQALKGHLDTLLLASLASLANGPRHGYAVQQALRTGSGARFDLPTGTIYPALRRLEAAGLVQGTWSQAGGRRRRTYELTPAGRQRLRRDRAAWRDFAAAVSAILEPAR
ncbi:MAG TPA: helix-turn-helix transcriptional regulator [Streptosporangiaceae bacterium]|jgi:PadR family transcriptional regulator, regulatory protein PadR|nr:helix-turn-helix transcriptional regulator [Streptosporangiaceae bacterium]